MKKREKKKQSDLFGKLQNYVLIYVRDEYFFSYAKITNFVPQKMLKKFWLKKYNTIFFLSTKKLCNFYWYVNTGIIILYYIILYYKHSLKKKKKNLMQSRNTVHIKGLGLHGLLNVLWGTALIKRELLRIKQHLEFVLQPGKLIFVNGYVI